MKHFSRRILLFIIYVILALSVVAQDAAVLHLPPGRLVDVGGWKLHLNCTGTKSETSPTVILEAGAGDFSATWTFVQPEVASFARVCSYDRGDSGWSDLGPHPRTFHQVAYELRTLLKNAGENGALCPRWSLLWRSVCEDLPHGVPSGCRWNGARRQRSRKRITVRQWAFYPNRRISAATARSFRENINPLRESEIPVDIMRALTESAKQMAKSANDPPYNKLPPEIQAIRTWVMNQPKHAAASDNPFEPEERVALLATIHSTPLGDRPLVVLTRGNPVYAGRPARTATEGTRPAAKGSRSAVA